MIAHHAHDTPTIGILLISTSFSNSGRIKVGPTAKATQTVLAKTAAKTAKRG